ncbi:hypothetical protein NMG60_11027536 [Bertholletia excelsa]
MDCLVLPAMLKRRCSGSRLRYRLLSDQVFGECDDPVTVVVGKERREFTVDPFVLEEDPFRVLIDLLGKENRGRVDIDGAKRVIFVDVEAILFEHLLWLMQNDSACFLQLNLKEILEFYAQDN